MTDKTICRVCEKEFQPKKRERLCSTDCKILHDKEYKTKWNRENRIRRNTTVKNYRNDPSKLSIMLCLRAKSRAKERKVKFDLTPEDIVIPDVCPVFKTQFKTGTVYAASLDRIEPSLGYVKDNVQVLSRKANLMKQDATQDELRMFAEWIEKNR